MCSICTAGGLHAVPVSPVVYPNLLMGTAGPINLLPTQTLYHINCSVHLEVNDYVFFRPKEGTREEVTLLGWSQSLTLPKWCGRRRNDRVFATSCYRFCPGKLAVVLGYVPWRYIMCVYIQSYWTLVQSKSKPKCTQPPVHQIAILCT